MEIKIKQLDRILDNSYQTTMLFSKIGQSILTDLKIKQKREQDPSGKSWKPLSPATLKVRAKQGSGAKILRDTGAMFLSLNQKPTSTSVTIGFGTNYAKSHQLGIGVPQRRILPITQSELPLKDIQKHIFKAINE